MQQKIIVIIGFLLLLAVAGYVLLTITPSFLKTNQVMPGVHSTLSPVVSQAPNTKNSTDSQLNKDAQEIDNSLNQLNTDINQSGQDQINQATDSITKTP